MSEGTPPPENPPGGQAGGTPPPPPPYGQPAPPSGETPPASGGGYGSAPYSPAPPPPPYAASGPRPAELLDRFLARLIDFVILIAVTVVINVFLLAAVFSTNGSVFGGGTFLYGAVSAVISVVIYLGYFAFMESSQGKTVGKMALKLHVESDSGGNPTLEQAIKRNIWLGLPILGVIPILGGVVASLGELAAVIVIAIQISSDPERKPWTDKLASTHVVKEG